MLAENRTTHEVAHGKYLAENDPVMTWGWGSPAGKLRAERRAALIARGARLAPGMRVLEIGCGTGLFTEKFAQSGAKILAVDLSADLLALARQRNLPPEQVTFLEAPFEECAAHGPFDAIIGSSILHHLDCAVALPKIFSLLESGGGGRFSFCEPNMLNPQIWITLHFRRFFPWMSPDETAFKKWEMRQLLTTVGFTEIAITPFDWLHPRVPEKLIPTVKCGERFSEKCPLLREFAGSLWITARRPGGENAG
jgi:SAM-dependent methyltransferase